MHVLTVAVGSVQVLHPEEDPLHLSRGTEWERGCLRHLQGAAQGLRGRCSTQAPAWTHSTRLRAVEGHTPGDNGDV